MSEVPKLKCQFCSLDFSSAYKIIPHIYFGHRKKLCRQVRDRGEILLKSPFPGNQFEHRMAVDAGSAPEEVYAKAAEMFSVLEEHILSVSGEEKLTKCPYCQVVLSTLPHSYWVHLEEHMNMNNSSPSTPAKTTPTTPSSASRDTPVTTQVGASPTLKTASQSTSDVAASASASPVKERIEVCKSEPDPEAVKEPAVAGIEPINKGRVTRSKQKSQEQIRKELLEIEKKIALKKKDEDEKKRIEEEESRNIMEAEKQIRQQEEEEKRKRAEQEEKEKREEAARLKKIEDDLQRQKEEEQLQKEIERKMAEERSQREKAEIKRKKEEEESRRKQEELIRQREAELQRLKQQEEVERQKLKELERKRKDEEERRRMEEEQRRQKEADLKRQVDEQMRLLKQVEDSKNSKKDQDHSHSSRWDREESSNTVIKSPVDMVPLRSPAEMIKSPVERPKSDDKMDTRSSGRQTPASRTRSREVSGELERDPRRRRSTSGDKKHSSVWHKEREAAWEKPEAAQVSPDQNPKPVLTEEMERSIIYGNFKKKEKTREDKLVDVKKEIEARFKAEEERRKRILEEKRKAEEKEREKQRLAEEKLKREKEKLREEKRKTKQRLEELRIKEKDPEPELEEEAMIEDEIITKEEDNTDEEPPSPKKARDKSPDQYEKIKMEIKKIDREIEKKQEARKNVQSSEEARSVSISPEPEPEILETRTVSLLPPESDTARTGVRSVVAYQVEDEEDDDDEEEDELEAMMRDFQERESQKPLESSHVTDPDRAAPKLPAMSDKTDNEISSSVTRFEVKCPIWKDLMGNGQSYESAYDFLADVYLGQRKKIISRSRKARKMVLTCPANSGFSTAISDDGVSIDYFTSELPLHLAALCDHLRSGYTGEDRRPGDHTKSAFWQLLANHRDTRRVHCPSCNTFPFKNSGCMCSEQTDKASKSLEELARDVETGILKSEDLRPPKPSSNDVDSEIETLKSERLMRASEKRLEREKEERQIVIPRLPRMFGPEEVRTPASWKYHVMAHKYGEVWCHQTQSCILGYKYLEGLEDGSGEPRVKVVRYRGDTWLDIDQRKVKVFYEYEGLETVARVSLNNNTITGTGGNHEQATRNLQQEVKRHIEKLKVCLILFFYFSFFHLILSGSRDQQCECER